MPYIKNLKANIDEYIQNKSWYWFVPVWVFGFYIFYLLLGFHLGEPAPLIISLAHGINFVLHEMSHLLTAFLPPLLTASAGSLSELLLGSLLIVTAFKTRGYFASLFCFLWLMLSAISTGDYMADARAQSLPLVSFGGEDAIHDWNFVFGKLGLLQADTFIGGCFRLIGIAMGLIGLGFSAWLIFRIAASEKKPVVDAEADTLLKETAESHGLKAAPLKHYNDLQSGNLYPEVNKGPLKNEPEQNNPK